MIKQLLFDKKKKRLTGEVVLPASKSISNRLLIIKYLSGSKAKIENLSDADDTKLLAQLIKKLEKHKDFSFDAGNAGTVMRFATALLSVIDGSYTLTASERMKKRPVSALVDALRELGAQISYANEEGMPPLLIRGKKLKHNTIHIDASESSQFISALLLIAPLIEGGLEIIPSGKPVSRPYIAMTEALMREAGIDITDSYEGILVKEDPYRFEGKKVEADWSAAAFFYEMLSLADEGEFFLKGLEENSLQGDAVIAGLFDYLGVKTLYEPEGVRIIKTGEAKKNIRVDFNDHPDLALPYIVSCAALDVIGTFTGLENLRIKESDRLEALSEGLAKFDYDFRETGFGEWVLINSCRSDKSKNTPGQNIVIQTFNDHRVAMAFAPMVLKTGKLAIENPDVVEKSFPEFWLYFDEIINKQV